MSETKERRGRPSYKDGENPNIVIIRDEKIKPFHIVKDQHTYTLFEKSKVTRGFAGKSASNKEVENIVGYYSSFKSCLKKIAKEKFMKKHKNYDSISEYINEWKNVEKGLETLLKPIEI